MLRLLALTILALAALATPAGAATRPGCFAAEGRTVASGERARAYVALDNLYGCLRGQRTRIRLAENYDDEYVTSGQVGDVVVAGHYVAFEYAAMDISCKTVCPPDYDQFPTSLTVANLRTRARRATDRHDGEPFVLTRTGVAAWIASGTVLAFHRDWLRPLDAGPVEEGSLEASATRVTWLRDGIVRGAVLR